MQAEVLKKKIVMIGGECTGKTAILKNITKQAFTKDDLYEPTQFPDFKVKRTPDDKFSFQIWDIPFSNRNVIELETHVREADLVMFVFAVISPETFGWVKMTYDYIKPLIKKDAQVLVTGTKVDLMNIRGITADHAEQWCLENEFYYLEFVAINGNPLTVLSKFQEIFEKEIA